MKMNAPPDPDLPDYLLDALGSRTVPELLELSDYCVELAEYKQREIDNDEIEGEMVVDESGDREIDDPMDEFVDQMDVEDAEHVKGVALQKRKIPCGPGCNGCPHGPYFYILYRDKNGDVKSEYKGKA